MTAYLARSGPAVTRHELVEQLAETSHKTWMRQAEAEGKPTHPRVTDHDRERAEDIVEMLDDVLGVLRRA